MKNIWILTIYTLKEAFARKVFIFFAIISFLLLIIMALIFSLVDTDSIIASFNLIEDKIDLSKAVTALELMFISPLAHLGLLLAIFSCSSFLPNMLESGNIDLLISKPVSRSQLIWGKYFGGLLVVLLNISFLIIGVWLIISIKFSYWDLSLLWLIPIITFTFVVLYGLIILLGVITKSSIIGMMSAYFILIILSPLLSGFKNNFNLMVKSEFLKTLIDGLYYIVPKTSELMGTISINLAAGNGIENFQPVISSFLFLILVMFLSLFLFERKDF
jgi:ABC-type transport system involved in multi-copper enzyme maturation permease subunit